MEVSGNGRSKKDRVEREGVIYFKKRRETKEDTKKERELGRGEEKKITKKMKVEKYKERRTFV